MLIRLFSLIEEKSHYQIYKQFIDNKKKIVQKVLKNNQFRNYLKIKLF